MNPIKEISKLAKHILPVALLDIQSRITHWLASGGKVIKRRIQDCCSDIN